MKQIYCRYCGQLIPKESKRRIFCSDECYTLYIPVEKRIKKSQNKGEFTSACFICNKDLPYGKTICRGCLGKTKMRITEECIENC